MNITQESISILNLFIMILKILLKFMNYSFPQNPIIFTNHDSIFIITLSNF